MVKKCKKILIIGAGFSGLSSACYLAHKGYDVTVMEKHEMPGGRARRLKESGFSFDMGPTWYWMPDVFERFFNDFGKEVKDFYRLSRLDPAYTVYYGINDKVDVSADLNELYTQFEVIEKGSSSFLKDFLKKAEYNYRASMGKVVYKPGLSPFELVSTATIKRLGQFVSSIKKVVRKGIKDSRLAQLLEFPVLFLGATPKDTPAFYCFMNYADMVLGTYYPNGGMYSVVEGIHKLAENLGVKFRFNQNLKEIIIEDNKAVGIRSQHQVYDFDILLSSADYQFTESLLPELYRNYSQNYWESRVMAPSALLFYVGFDKRLKNISHHTLFFDSPFDEHANAIYKTKKWPDKPLFYASFPSLTDKSTAPEGYEAGIFLIPLAPDIEDTEEIREKYFDEIITRFENITQQSVRLNVIYKRSYCVNDFKQDYNAYKGNAYGLSNILKQTAFLKPKLKNKHLPNMFYTGQLTVPGPGVPPAIISGKIVSELVEKYTK